jgi:hypothetical protein
VLGPPEARRSYRLTEDSAGGNSMATAVLMVRMNVRKDLEAEFNRFYDEVHIPDVLAFPGAVSFRRYRALLGEDRYQLLSFIEFKDEVTLRLFLDSDYRKTIADKIDAKFGAAIERHRSAYEQTWP